MSEVNNIIALDVGDARVGVALANSIARLPSPLAILQNDEHIFENITKLTAENKAGIIVIGLPRNMNGEETAQSKTVRDFASELGNHSDAPIIFVDESLSTKRAEEYSHNQKRPPGKHLDDIAACFILEEYLGSNDV